VSVDPTFTAPESNDSLAQTASGAASIADFKIVILDEPPRRSRTLMGLYQAYLGLSAADGALTWVNVRRGAAERNPILGYRAGSAFYFLMMKAGTTASSIYFVERFRRNHPRAAVVTMATVNGALSWVVWHNAHVFRMLK
jgi:hypothetical protein